MICKITNFLRIFFNRKKFVKFEFSIYDYLFQHGAQVAIAHATRHTARYGKTRKHDVIHKTGST